MHSSCAASTASARIEWHVDGDRPVFWNQNRHPVTDFQRRVHSKPEKNQRTTSEGSLKLVFAIVTFLRDDARPDLEVANSLSKF